MVKILLADTDTKRNSASCQFLSNEKDFEIESTNWNLYNKKIFRN